MTINDVTVPARRTRSFGPSRMPTRRLITIGAPALAVAIVALAAVVQSSDHQTSQAAVRAAPSVDARSITEDLVNRGLIPRQTLEPAPQSPDDIVRDLVNRGLIPRQTLEPAPQSRNDIVQDLVDRGIVPAATLDD